MSVDPEGIAILSELAGKGVNSITKLALQKQRAKAAKATKPWDNRIKKSEAKISESQAKIAAAESEVRKAEADAAFRSTVLKWSVAASVIIAAAGVTFYVVKTRKK